MMFLERPIAQFDGRAWRLVQTQALGGLVQEEYVPEGTSLDYWEELLTITTRPGEQHLSAQVFVDALDKMLKSRISDGTLEYSVTYDAEEEFMFEWSLVNDVVMLDQFAIARGIRGSFALHLVQYESRKAEADGHNLNKWRAILKTIRLAYLPRRAETMQITSPGATLDYEKEVAEILAAVAQGKRPIDDNQRAQNNQQNVNLCRRAIQLIDKQRDSYRWAYFHTLLGAYLIEVASKSKDEDVESAEEIEAAIDAIRRSLEVFNRDEAPELWGVAMRNLGRAFLRRSKGDHTANVERAITCQARSLLAFPPETHPSEWAAALHSLGHTYRERGRDTDGVNLTLAAEAFQKALAVYAATGDTMRWADTMYSLGYLYESFAQSNADDYLDVALDYYRQVVNAVSVSSEFEESGRTAGDTFVEHGSQIAHAYNAINRIARMRAGEGKLPIDIEDGVMLGKVVFLRPFVLHNQIRLRNDFKIWDSPLPRWEVEPETLSVEEVMSRTLGHHMSFHALGGAPETYGGDHMYSSSADRWQLIFEEVMLPVADLFLVIPHDSPGLRWEVEILKAHGALSRCLFIMPPSVGEHYSNEMWQQTEGVMQSYGLHLPSYDEEGMLFRLGASGEVEEIWSFNAVWTGMLIEQIKHLLPAHDEIE